MNLRSDRLAAIAALLAVTIGTLFTAADAAAQVCPGTTVASDLRRPMAIDLSNQGNLLVSETGTAIRHSGRISIVHPEGGRRTLLDGLPSGINDVAEPSGPAGLVMQGRTAYVLIGIGDSVLPAAIPGRHLPNPNVSSPIYSSILAIHFSARVEKSTAGFTLSSADQQALADGQRVILSNGGGDTIEIEMVTNFPDYVPDPLPGSPQIVRGSNPFGLALVDDRIYVTDGGRNLVWTVDTLTGAHAPLTTFGTIPNPLFPIGGPVVEAVPTGITAAKGQLLVTLFRGAPFPPNTSVVVQIDPATGQQSPFISGLKTAIGILQTTARGDDHYLVLQHSSGAGPFFPGPGLILAFDSPTAAPTTVVNCLARPTAMLLDPSGSWIYAAELLTGKLIAFQR